MWGGSRYLPPHQQQRDAVASLGRADPCTVLVDIAAQGLPAEKLGLDKVPQLPAGAEPALVLDQPGRANHYAVPSTMPPGEPTKRVEIVDIEDVKAAVKETGELKFCRCWKSAAFPFCDGSHDGHNLACDDNTSPLVIKSGAAL